MFSLSVVWLFIDDSLCCTDAFKFDVVPCVDLLFILLVSCKKKSLPILMNFFLTFFFSKSFMVSSLVLKSFIHSELVFVSDVRQECNLVVPFIPNLPRVFIMKDWYSL